MMDKYVCRYKLSKVDFMSEEIVGGSFVGSSYPSDLIANGSPTERLGENKIDFILVSGF